MSPEKRQEAVDEFQNDPNCRVLIGTIGACSEGFTMTAARVMIFPERSWVPGQVTQAEDRIHRRGQTESALYKHMVRENSLSERQVKILIKKQEQADSMLDKRTNE